MSVLFPTFLSLGKRIKRLLATDVKSIWQALEESAEPTQEVFFDGFIYYPPIVWKQVSKERCIESETSSQAEEKGTGRTNADELHSPSVGSISQTRTVRSN